MAHSHSCWSAAPQLRRVGAAVLMVAALLGPVEASAQVAPALYRPALPSGLDLYLPVPEDNALTPEKVRLGRALFFDPILSRDGSLSCATCHELERAFTDGRPVSRGVFDRVGTRNAPTLVNRAYGESQFFDGRASSLEEQAILPIQSPKELDLRLEEALARLRGDAEYPELFRTAFGRAPDVDGLAKALASYVRTIVAGGSPVDWYLRGERGAITELEEKGLRVFQGKGRCSACHIGPNFTDERFHNTGVAWQDGELLDPGRFAITGDESERGAFKAPSLREIARTAPYMHDGTLATLEDVIEFYDRGGNPNPYLDAQIRPLHLRPSKMFLVICAGINGPFTCPLLLTNHNLRSVKAFLQCDKYQRMCQVSCQNDA